ncbi:MAG TPA: nitrilase-related carbon-nitrogen hydrolase [Bryobacteraceae bacterium]|nr:nitrilase-related carbon-nitrogen hydrolase [Bryobacteraceae bacterium]
MKSVKVAVIQAGSYVFDTTRTVVKLRSYCQQAAHAGASLAVFPEAFLGGYPKGIDFGARVGSRSPEGRDDFRRYWDAAIEVPGKETAIVAETAAAHRMRIVAGVIERGGGTLYCTALFFSPEGELEAKHRKLMPTAMERLIWGFGDGSTMPAIQTEYGIVGAAICWENYMPLFRSAMYGKGVNLWCAPTVDDRETWTATMQHIALEGRCFVLSACQYLVRSDCPPDYHPMQGETPDTVLIKGGSVIVSPLGRILAGPLRDGEGILTAELDLDEIARGKFDFDAVGHYARPDVFTLSVDERPKPAVKYSA